MLGRTKLFLFVFSLSLGILNCQKDPPATTTQTKIHDNSNPSQPGEEKSQQLGLANSTDVAIGTTVGGAAVVAIAAGVLLHGRGEAAEGMKPEDEVEPREPVRPEETPRIDTENKAKLSISRPPLESKGPIEFPSDWENRVADVDSSTSLEARYPTSESSFPPTLTSHPLDPDFSTKVELLAKLKDNPFFPKGVDNSGKAASFNVKIGGKTQKVKVQYTTLQSDANADVYSVRITGKNLDWTVVGKENLDSAVETYREADVLDTFNGQAGYPIYYGANRIGTNLHTFQEFLGPAPKTVTPDTLISLATSLNGMHSHDLAHLDLKPANVMWRGSDDPPTPVLIDFAFSATKNKTSTQVMSQPYAAPEIVDRVYTRMVNTTRKAEGQAPLPIPPASDPRLADIYSLGVTFWELLHGKKFNSYIDQFRGTSEATNNVNYLNQEVVAALKDPKKSSSFDQLIGEMLEVNPDSRPSLEAVIQKLNALKNN